MPPDRLLFWVAAVLLAGCGRSEGPPKMDYPESKPDQQVDVYHGVSVADPFRWLEDLAAESTVEWVAAQNALTIPYLEELPARAGFAERLRALIDYERFGIPQHRNGSYVYFHNTGEQEQDVVWLTEDPLERGRVLIDANRLSDDGTVSISELELSPDGLKLAYSISDGGSDWRTWRVMDLKTGTDLRDELLGMKFGVISWNADSQGFFYSRYPRQGDDYDDSQQVAVWFHKLGTHQDKDRQIFAVDDHPTRNPYGQVTDDGRYLIIDLFDGYQSNGIYYFELKNGAVSGDIVRLLDEWDARYQFIGNDETRLFFKTTNNAPLGRVIGIDITGPESENWQEIVPQAGETIEATSLVSGRLIVQYIVDAHAKVTVFDLAGEPVDQVSLPGKGTVAGFEGGADDVATFFSYTDFTTPTSVFQYELSTGQTTAINEPEVAVDTSRFETKQIFYESNDGTLVPMFIVHDQDMVRDGRQPTVLYGYGGFNVSLTPTYSTARMAWLESGGVYALANLRGGGEYGEAWHEAGIKLNKQNVFDDFIAAAEWLIGNDYTSPDRLAIWGGSNGGLLVAAVINQRPELFGAAVPAVGVLDMLRYQTASANARQWSSDYGLSEDEQEFQALAAYSPYHNLRSGVCYPPTLVLADQNDDRVVPWHSYKYAAALQLAQGCDNPVMIRIETRTGHGGGASTSKIVDEYADQWAFVSYWLGMSQ